jgi:hypothetical protein
MFNEKKLYAPLLTDCRIFEVFVICADSRSNSFVHDSFGPVDNDDSINAAFFDATISIALVNRSYKISYRSYPNQRELDHL